MPIQQGIEGTDGRYLRADGSVGLTANWDVGGQSIRGAALIADMGGVIYLGEIVNTLRISRSTGEAIQILGESNNLAELDMKNTIITDLAGIGVRAVLADASGRLSAP